MTPDALLEQFQYDDAASSFRRALELRPDLNIARLNLAIALFYAGHLDESLNAATAAAEALPALDAILKREDRGRVANGGPERARRRLGVVALHGEQDEIRRAVGLGRIGHGVDGAQDARLASAPDHEAARPQGVEVLAAGDERDRMPASGERRAVEAAHGAGAHHQDSHGDRP